MNMELEPYETAYSTHTHTYIYQYLTWYTFSFQQKNERLRGGAQTKRRSSFSSSDTGKPSPQITLKRHGSSESHHTLHSAGCAYNKHSCWIQHCL